MTGPTWHLLMGETIALRETLKMNKTFEARWKHFRVICSSGQGGKPQWWPWRRSSLRRLESAGNCLVADPPCLCLQLLRFHPHQGWLRVLPHCAAQCNVWNSACLVEKIVGNAWQFWIPLGFKAILSRRDRRPVKPISLGRPPAMSDSLVSICVDHILEGKRTLQNGDSSRIAGLKPTNNAVTLFGGENMFEHWRLTDLNHLLDRRIFRTKLVAYRSWFPISRSFQMETWWRYLCKSENWILQTTNKYGQRFIYDDP